MDKEKYVSREISWLSFNGRVLQEAADKNVPLIERIKFLSIFSNNLDEFFRVRVAALKRIVPIHHHAKEVTGENPKKILTHIHDIVVEQQKKFEATFQNIVKELEAKRIFILNEKQLSKEQGEYVRNYFQETVLPTLVPIMINSIPKFPYLKDKAIYFAIKLFKKNDPKLSKYALIQIPTDIVSRFLILPKAEGRKYIVLLDDVIRYCLSDVFSTFDFDKIEAYTIKLTRDAELDIDNDLSKSIAEKISKGLKQRKKGKPVRFVYDSKIPIDLMSFIMKKMKLKKEHDLIPGGRYHNFKDFIKFPKLGSADMVYAGANPVFHKGLKSGKSLFKTIRKKDILLSYPYQSYSHIIDLLREASIDPAVTSIKITLYRVAENSNIIWALTNAVKNGKDVTVVVEIQARFDEEANIYWANELQEEGATVIYGVQGLKVHSKLFLITRKEDGKTINYAHVGTGNFNETTAKTYCDHSLLTCDERITDEVSKVFHFLSNNFKTGNYKHLIVSPFFMRKKFSKLINKEIENAKQGKEASCIIKLNSLGDPDIIKKIYSAGEAGVKVKLIIRSNCAIVPKTKESANNIEIISIIDKYLEHARIFVFHNGGDEKYYISSADWMYRNFDQRVEVACPIYDKEIQKELRTILNIQLNDNVKARLIDENHSNTYKNGTGDKIRAQNEIYKYFSNKLNKN